MAVGLGFKCSCFIGDRLEVIMAKRWYVVQAYSGYEKKVMIALQERIALAGMEGSFDEILVPTEEVVEMRAGQKRKSERKFFPGYVLVHMELNDETWHLVKSTPRVLGFIGGTAERPAPITDKEAAKILSQWKRVKKLRLIRRSMSRVRWLGLLTGLLMTLRAPLKK